MTTGPCPTQGSWMLSKEQKAVEFELEMMGIYYALNFPTQQVLHMGQPEVYSYFLAT